MLYFSIFSKFGWFKTKQFTGLLEFIKLYKQNPLEKFFIFTIYQKYTIRFKNSCIHVPALHKCVSAPAYETSFLWVGVGGGAEVSCPISSNCLQENQVILPKNGYLIFFFFFWGGGAAAAAPLAPWPIRLCASVHIGRSGGGGTPHAPSIYCNLGLIPDICVISLYGFMSGVY